MFPCRAYSRCGSWTFTWTFLAVTRCSIGGITIETVQTDLAVKASSVCEHNSVNNQVRQVFSKTVFQVSTRALVFEQTVGGFSFAFEHDTRSHEHQSALAETSHASSHARILTHFAFFPHHFLFITSSFHWNNLHLTNLLIYTTHM